MKIKKMMKNNNPLKIDNLIKYVALIEKYQIAISLIKRIRIAIPFFFLKFKRT
jgi:hypothetical protein